MKLVTTFHSPSSVTSSLTCILTPDTEFGHLVVAKTNRIEVSAITGEGLRQECDLEIWGRVLTIRAVPVKRASGQCNNILVMTDHPDPRIIVLAYEKENGVSRLVDASSTSLHDRIARHAEFCNDVVVDPTGRIAVVSCYAGKLRILVFGEGVVEEEFDVTLPELNLLTLAFLHTAQDQYSLAIAHVDYLQRMQMISRDLNIESQELSPDISQILPSTVLSPAIFPFVDLAPILVPVPSFPLSASDEDKSEDRECPGGVLVVGGRKILFYEVAPPDAQAVRKGKKRRLDKKKSSTTEAEVEKSKEKEKERESRKLKPRCYVRWPWSEVMSSTTIDVKERKFLLGDKYGRMALLVLDGTPRLALLPIGETSPSTSLAYLSNQVVFVGSHLGPSQLLRIHQEIVGTSSGDTLPIPSGVAAVLSLSNPDGDDDDEGPIDNRKPKGIIIRNKGNHVEVLDTYRNIAPIMDAVLADTESSGQPQIVTCSGGASTGSLNIIRSGAEVKELATVEGLSCVTAIFPIRSRYESQTHSHLLISTSYESYILRLDGAETMTRLDSKNSPFVTTAPTLALSNISRRTTTNVGGKTTSSYVDSALVVQVTEKGIRVLEFDEDLGVFHVVGDGWSPQSLDHTWQGRDVVAASVNASQFVLAFRGGRLALFNLADGGIVKLIKFQDFLDAKHGPKEISSVSCVPFDWTKHFSLYIAISFWESRTVTILSLEKPDRYMTPICTTSELPSLPRSVILHNFGSGNKYKDEDYQPFVLAGLTDGTVVSFAFRNNQLLDKKVFGLGITPATLSSCLVEGRHAIFASGSRAAILHWDRKRLRQSAVMLKDIVTGVSLNTSSFPSALVTATSSGLIIGQVGGVDQMQVRSILLGSDNPTRIAHDLVTNMFGVACLHTSPNRVGDAETIESSFNIFDGNFRRLAQYTCGADEEITAIATSTTLSVSIGGRQHSCFLVGSVRHQLGQPEPKLGGLMVFVASPSGGSIQPLVSTKTDGCVYGIAALDNFIVAAVNTAIILYRINSTEDEDGLVLEQLSQWNHNYFITSLVAREGNIIAGDAISSVTVLNIQDTVLKTVVRDFAPLWPVAVEMTRNSGIVGADCDCNLFTFSMGTSGTRTVLERDGSYHVGEVINKFLPGGIGAPDSCEDTQFQPEHLFFTSSGRIGQTVQVADDVALHLTALQRNMAKVIKGPGDVSHTKTRAPTSPRGRTDAEFAFGFLDGDFLESFLVDSRQAQFLQGEFEVEHVGLQLSEAEALLEKLQSLH
ncbi:hypothetical protein EUX98_g3000 [Antrodiella citrinella]|uniref:DNA damage-binding protein 1 n=1 Tax=Antrodiella citrinella TaxID=2447956 RepID=A0A4S4MYX1_9APHY|nr:hypothetical protein EUX98_g3000 [Antrodiella citrinella]